MIIFKSIHILQMMLSRGQSTVPPQALKWEAFYDQQDCSRKLADGTRLFWESCGRLVDTLRYCKSESLLKIMTASCIWSPADFII